MAALSAGRIPSAILMRMVPTVIRFAARNLMRFCVAESIALMVRCRSSYPIVSLDVNVKDGSNQMSDGNNQMSDKIKLIQHSIERYASSRVQEELAGSRDAPMTTIKRHHDAGKAYWDRAMELIKSLIDDVHDQHY